MHKENYKWSVVGMLWGIAFFNYADRQAVFAVFPLLEKEMNLGPVQLGLLGSSFAIRTRSASASARFSVWSSRAAVSA